ncbi:hypothetical protein M8C21_023142 [Ambrosia artemisiifolia]|uniref:Uncharacterized protein n=1 Tax=Ambrosia artemisiifolia TaxID=4212 RepID=A0AAD5D148_AMBAR|nr:hypothetical protein M8C21_023142 [Ambrosia artemisiifolia]
MATGSNNLHVVFIPAFALGHMIPLVQAARLFAPPSSQPFITPSHSKTPLTVTSNAVTLSPTALLPTHTPIAQLIRYVAPDGIFSDMFITCCLTWLDDQKPNSVIYVCFGSMVRFLEAQITEIALALEESKQPLIWVNSALEAAAAGVPLITWSLYADHFYNEKLVELFGIGVGVGADVWNPSFVITSPVT